MSQFPFVLDSDIDLPRIDDNVTELGGEAINALRAAMFAVEANIGIGAAGTAGSIAQRLNASLMPDGTINPSVLIGLLTLVTITDAQVSPTASIQESKLNLSHSTQSLYNLYITLKSSIDILNGFLSLTGVKLEPHIDGTNYNHLLSAIHVDAVPGFVKTNPSVLPSVGTNVINRNTTNADTLLEDINNDLVVHEKSDSTPGVTAVAGGTVPPENYAHMASGVYVNPASFVTIPQSNNDVQKVVDFIDNSSLFLLGGRVQNFYSNGIPNTSRSSSLLADGYGEPIVPPTPVTAFFLNVPPGPTATSPVDDFTHGDDVVLFNPTSTQLSTFNFDAQFAQVSPGDLITIDYGTGVFYQFAVDSVKTLVSGSVRTYAVRINGKNPVADGYAYARIDHALFHRNKFGVLSTARAPNEISAYESLIITNPRSAIALGNGFNATEFDSGHYNLYLTLLSNGDTSNIYFMPAIDVTGNKGTTPGAYTLDSIVDNINTAFRAPGFNYRFTAFEYNGQIGISLDPFNNAAFSIIGGVVDSITGNYTSTSNASYPDNVVDGYNLIDPLGFGTTGANIASPPPALAYPSIPSARFAPTLLFYPLKRNFFYANGVERDRLNSDPLTLNNIEDVYGDGYWPAIINTVTAFPSRVEVVYTINLDLSHSGLAAGKTIVIQPLVPINSIINDVNYGRFIVSNVSFTNCPGPAGFTNITVYDAVHGAGVSPSLIFPTGTPVNIYFCDDSVSFDTENVFDANSTDYPYKRFFEVYVDGFGHTTTHERARFSLVTTSANISTINIYDVSPKLRGYTTSGTDKEIRLFISSYDSATGLYFAQLGRWNPSSSTFTNLGPVISGQKGLVTRLYDETNIDFIDFIFSPDATTVSFTFQVIDIQLFSTLELDQQFMLLATCQVNDSLKSISYLNDKRQFGNVSEDQFSTSAINFINASDRELHENGIIRGFDTLDGYFANTNAISFSGGTALVNGKLVQVNAQTIHVPTIVEALPTVSGGAPSLASTVNVITWFVCVNDEGELELIASTDYNPFGSFAAQYIAGNVNHLRLFYGLNLNATSAAPYQIRGTYFGNLVLNQKDVTPIAVAVATVTKPGSTYNVTSLVVSDAKRYISNGYGGLTDPMTVGLSASFRNFGSIITWLDQLNNYISASAGQGNPISNTVIVKGHVPILGTVRLDYAFGEVRFEGDAGMFDVYVPTAFELGSNVHFNNITFNYYYDPVAYNSIYHDVSGGHYNPTNPGGNAPADLINTGRGLIHAGISLFENNIAITNCHFIWYPLVASIGGLPPFVPPAPISSVAIDRYSFINIEFEQALVGAPPVILQNINISNNTFTDNVLTSFILPNYETVRAAIAFVCLSNIVSSSKLINATIKNNTCNKDQMIAIVPASVAITNAVTTAIDTTNCVIEGNACGAISVFTQFVPILAFEYTSNYFNFMLDKNVGLNIRGNTCKYITSTDARGIDLATMTGGQITINVGPMVISDNTCSWIKLPINVWTGGGDAMPCVIKNNNLSGYNTNFRKNYLDGYTSALTNAAIELIIIGTSSFVGSVIIDGNWINAGAYIVDFSPFTTTYWYDVGIYTQHDGDICNNVIENLNPVLSLSPPTGIVLHGCISSNIHHNKLFRTAFVIWTAYINLGNTGTHQVTNNFFDQTTPDGIFFHAVNQIIATGGTVNSSSIHDNINQAIFEAISFADDKLTFTTAATYLGQTIARVAPFPGTLPFVAPGVLYIDDLSGVSIHKFSDVFSQTSEYIGIFETAGTGHSFADGYVRNMSLTVPLTSRLPNGVKIVGISVGIWIAHSGVAQFDTSSNANNNFSLSLTSTRSNVFSGTTNTPVTDVKNNLSPFFNPLTTINSTNNPTSINDFSVGSNQSSTLILGTGVGTPPYTIVSAAAAVANTQYINVIAPGSFLYTTGNGYRISAQLDMCWLRTGGVAITDTIQIYISPVLVTYQW